MGPSGRGRDSRGIELSSMELCFLGIRERRSKTFTSLLLCAQFTLDRHSFRETTGTA